MASEHKPKRRPYNAPGRAAAAMQTRESIVRAAKLEFEQGGWSGTTIRSIAASSGHSPKTVEAVFGTKAAVLRAVVDFSIRGDLLDVPVNQRESALLVDAAPTAAQMLDLHATHVRAINERTARVAWVVEQAAPGVTEVATLWQRMTDNRRHGVLWATRTLLATPDAPSTLAADEVENTFWLALDWATYRSLTDGRGLTGDEFEEWLRAFYRRMLLGSSL